MILIWILWITAQYLTYLVGGLNPSEKYKSVGMLIPNIWKNKKCSKPPTRYPLENQVSQLCSTTAAPGPVKWPLLQRCDSCDME